MNSRLSILAVVTVLSFAPIDVVQAAAAGSVSVVAVKDNFARKGQPDTVQPYDSFIIVKGENDGFNRKAWIGFELPCPGIEYGSIAGAAFSITFHSTGGVGSGIRSFDVYALTNETIDSWTEETLTWNNAPANDLSSNSVLPGDTTFVGSFSFDAKAAHGLVVSVSSTAIDDFVATDTDGQLTFIVIRSTIASDGQNFDSSETAPPEGVDGPRLAFDADVTDCNANGIPDDCETGPDTDGDGLLDECDGCPLDPTKIEPGQCDCGTPDTDTDGDGVADCNDACPLDPMKTDPGACGCGVEDLDADADGVFDCMDNCPGTANPSQTDCNGNGIGDACEAFADCNANGIPDDCDPDGNGTGIPDDCESRGDSNGDGFVDVTDLLALLAVWGPCPAPCPEDLNGDGSVNVTDLLALLANWG